MTTNSHLILFRLISQQFLSAKWITTSQSLYLPLISVLETFLTWMTIEQCAIISVKLDGSAMISSFVVDVTRTVKLVSSMIIIVLVAKSHIVWSMGLNVAAKTELIWMSQVRILYVWNVMKIFLIVFNAKVIYLVPNAKITWF